MKYLDEILALAESKYGVRFTALPRRKVYNNFWQKWEEKSPEAQIELMSFESHEIPNEIPIHTVTGDTLETAAEKMVAFLTQPKP